MDAVRLGPAWGPQRLHLVLRTPIGGSGRSRQLIVRRRQHVHDPASVVGERSVQRLVAPGRWQSPSPPTWSTARPAPGFGTCSARLSLSSRRPVQGRPGSRGCVRASVRGASGVQRRFRDEREIPFWCAAARLSRSRGAVPVVYPRGQTRPDRRSTSRPPHPGERLGQTRVDGSGEPTDQELRVRVPANVRPDECQTENRAERSEARGRLPGLRPPWQVAQRRAQPPYPAGLASARTPGRHGPGDTCAPRRTSSRRSPVTQATSELAEPSAEGPSRTQDRTPTPSAHGKSLTAWSERSDSPSASWQSSPR